MRFGTVPQPAPAVGQRPLEWSDTQGQSREGKSAVGPLCLPIINTFVVFQFIDWLLSVTEAPQENISASSLSVIKGKDMDMLCYQFYGYFYLTEITWWD